MRFLLLVLVLMLAWAAATGAFGLVNLLVGAAVAALAVLFVRERVGRPGLMGRIGRVAALVLMGARGLALSALQMARIAVVPDSRLKPGVFAYPLAVTTDRQIALLAGLTTLMPGTLGVDVSEDRSALLVHTLDLGGQAEAVRVIRDGLEARIIAVCGR